MLSLVLAQVVAIRGATLAGAAPEPARPAPVTVLIEGERIRAVGPDVAVPEGARVIDGSGLFLAPAPLDAFAYWSPGHDPLYAAAGIALVADHGNELVPILAARAAPRSGLPTLHTAGAVIDGFPPSTTNASVARTPVEAEAQLEALAGEGIDFVAFQSSLTLEPWRKLVEVAHAKKLLVWGPLPRGATLAVAVDGGQDGLLFLDGLLPAGKSWDAVQLADFEPAVAKLASARTRVVPLLSTSARLLANWSADAPELALLAPEFANYWRSELAARTAMFQDPAARERFTAQGTKVLDLQRALLQKLHAAGARLVPGSGAPHPWLFPGGGLHDELAQWQAAGIPAAEVLRCATSGAAEALGLGATRGALEPGKLADLVLVRADPALDVGALRQPEWVVLRGTPRSRAELDQALAELRELQARADSETRRPIEVGDPPRPEGELVLAGYCETSSLGVRSAAERYAVVRTADGKLSFGGLRVVPQADGTRIEVESQLRVSGKDLEHFKIRVRSAKHELSVEGFWTANQMRVERRIDGVHVDLRTTPERIGAVDAGSVTTALLLAATQEGGQFHVLVFHEALELEVVKWSLRLDGEGTHWLATPDGPKVARFDARGGLAEWLEQRGSAGVRTLGTNTLAEGRAGLPLAGTKLQAVERARQAEAAAREAAGKAPPKKADDPGKPGGGR